MMLRKKKNDKCAFKMVLKGPFISNGRDPL